MTRLYNVTYSEHLKFQPEPLDAPTKGEPNRKIEQPLVDTWRTKSRLVAIDEGYAEDAIAKVRRLAEQDEDAQNGKVAEVQIIGVVLQAEAD